MSNFKRLDREVDSGVEQTHDDSLECAAREFSWWCTRPIGHSGPHVAGNGFDETYASWDDASSGGGR